MKLLYVTDNVFVKEQNQIFTLGQYQLSYWVSYLKVFDRITVLGREEKGLDVKSETLLRPATSNRVEVVSVHNLSSLLGQLFNRRPARIIISQAVRESDVVLARLHCENGLLAINEAIRLGKPWAVEVASCAWDCLWNYGSISAKLYAPILYFRTKRVIKKSPLTIYVTRKFLQKRYPNTKGKSFSVSDVCLSQGDRTSLHKREEKIQSGKEKVVLGLIGTLGTRYKGIQTVFNAISDWPECLLRIEFRILGTGPRVRWEEEARRLGVSDMTIFCEPRYPGKEVMAWLDGIDIYLQPSMAEGLPRSLIEAMSRGCPCIGSRCGGITELLEEECLIEPGNTSQLREILKTSISDQEWQLNQARRNFQEALKYNEINLLPKRIVALSQIKCSSEQRNLCRAVKVLSYLALRWN